MRMCVCASPQPQIAKTSLKVCFPDYDGPPGEARPALDFIQAKYTNIMEKVRSSANGCEL